MGLNRPIIVLHFSNTTPWHLTPAAQLKSLISVSSTSDQQNLFDRLWTKLPSMNTARWYHACSVVPRFQQSHLVVIGGTNSANVSIDTTELYNLMIRPSSWVIDGTKTFTNYFVIFSQRGKTFSKMFCSTFATVKMLNLFNSLFVQLTKPPQNIEVLKIKSFNILRRFDIIGTWQIVN